jgi:hypothetical protein
MCLNCHSVQQTTALAQFATLVSHSCKSFETFAQDCNLHLWWILLSSPKKSIFFEKNLFLKLGTVAKDIKLFCTVFLGASTLHIMPLSITTINIMAFRCDTHHNGLYFRQSLCQHSKACVRLAILSNTLYCYAEFHYAVFCHTECCGAVFYVLAQQASVFYTSTLVYSFW